MNCGLFFILLVLKLELLCALDSDFLYDEQDKWPGLCKTGKKQSPINLDENKAEKKKLPINFEGYDKGVCGKLSNNGRTLQIDFGERENDGHLPSISGPLKIKYVLNKIVFHWSAEHTMKGERQPLEVQVVHINSQYGSFAEAIEMKDGVAILSTLYKISKDKSMKKFEKILSDLPETPQTKPKDICDIDLKIFLHQNSNKYYHYEGSWTCPDCQETVSWMVFKDPAEIAKPEWDKLISIKDKKGKSIKSNFRKTQNLNGRKIILSE